MSNRIVHQQSCTLFLRYKQWHVHHFRIVPSVPLRHGLDGDCLANRVPPASQRRVYLPHDVQQWLQQDEPCAPAKQVERRQGCRNLRRCDDQEGDGHTLSGRRGHYQQEGKAGQHPCFSSTGHQVRTCGGPPQKWQP